MKTSWVTTLKGSSSIASVRKKITMSKKLTIVIEEIEPDEYYVEGYGYVGGYNLVHVLDMFIAEAFKEQEGWGQQPSEGNL